MINALTAAHFALLSAVETEARSGSSLQQLQDALDESNTQVLGYWQQEALIGYAIVARLPFEAELQAIGVLPASQRLGVGKALLGAVIRCAKQWESERLLLEVRASNKRAITLYQRYGFNEDGHRKKYYPATQGAAGREDALLMSRPC